uniref:Putative mob1/phocein family n=1 Tax=Xenopsylla cheopis TaxID=163159 RepID=A0A6M2DD50_XENCH
MGKARRKERDGDGCPGGGCSGPGGGATGGAGGAGGGDPKLYLEEAVLERKLPDADLRLLVDLPAGLDYNEWLASHTMALFEHVNLVYGTVSEFCTMSGCPDMIGPGTRTYLWFDEKGKKTRVPAPQYIDFVMTFIQRSVADEAVFPTKYGRDFPTSFEVICRKILRLLFHVVAHLYAAHFREVALLGLHAHLNLTFAHLTALHRRFSLIEAKETEVLRDLELALRLSEDSNSTQNNTNAATNDTTATGDNPTSSNQKSGTSTTSLACINATWDGHHPASGDEVVTNERTNSDDCPTSA